MDVAGGGATARSGRSSGRSSHSSLATCPFGRRACPSGRQLPHCTSNRNKGTLEIVLTYCKYRSLIFSNRNKWDLPLPISILPKWRFVPDFLWTHAALNPTMAVVKILGCSTALAALLAVVALSAAAQATQPTAAPPTLQSAATPSPQPPPATQPSPLDDARSLLQQGKITDADHATREFLRNHTDSAEGHFLLGFILFREVQSHGTDESTLSYAPPASEAKFREAKAKESLAEFTEGAKYQVPSEFDLKIVSFDYILLADYTDADKWLTRAVQRNPQDFDAWYNLARTKYSENRFDESIQAFQKCLALDPKNVKAENNLGLAYEGLGSKDDAIAAYKAAIDWQAQAPQKDHEPYINLGSLLLDQDRPKEALTYLQQATAMAPEDAKGHERLGKAYAHLNELPQAQSELEKAVALAPYVASLHFMLGQVYRREGLIEKAKAEFKRTDELNGTHSSDKTPEP